MQNKKIYYLSAFLIMLFVVNTVFAQPRRRKIHRPRRQIEQPSAIGLRVGNDFENEQLMAGGHLWLPLGVLWKFVPSAEYYFTENDTTRWQFNGDFLFKPNPRGFFYLGAGVAVQYLDSEYVSEEFDFGGNLIAGMEFGRIRSPITPYIQARWTFIDDDQFFTLLGGINFVLK